MCKCDTRLKLQALVQEVRLIHERAANEIKMASENSNNNNINTSTNKLSIDTQFTEITSPITPGQALVRMCEQCGAVDMIVINEIVGGPRSRYANPTTPPISPVSARSPMSPKPLWQQPVVRQKSHSNLLVHQPTTQPISRETKVDEKDNEFPYHFATLRRTNSMIKENHMNEPRLTPHGKVDPVTLPSRDKPFLKRTASLPSSLLVKVIKKSLIID